MSLLLCHTAAFSEVMLSALCWGQIGQLICQSPQLDCILCHVQITISFLWCLKAGENTS